MTTKSEFVEMWDNGRKEYKTIVLKNKTGWIESNFSVFANLGDGRVFVELYIVGIDSTQLISMIDIEMIEEVI